MKAMERYFSSTSQARTNASSVVNQLYYLYLHNGLLLQWRPNIRSLLWLTWASNQILFLSVNKSVVHSQLSHKKNMIKAGPTSREQPVLMIASCFFLILYYCILSHWDFWWIIITKENSQILYLRFCEFFFTIIFVFHQNGLSMF